MMATYTSAFSTTTGTASVDTWPSWNLQYTTASTTSTSVTWSAWNQDVTAATSDLINDTVWFKWSGDQWSQVRNPQQAARRQPTAEELEAAKQLKAEARRLEQERAARVKAEKERAEALLREHLTPEQQKQLDEEDHFEVQAASGKLYRINRGRQGNVFSLDARRRQVASHCIHPSDDCPDADTMLAQLCWLKWNEAEFLKVCNTTRIAA
jgi:hypothetical protein